MSSDTTAVDNEPGSGPGPELWPTPVPQSEPAPATGAQDLIECAKPTAPAFLHSPPDSNDATKSDASDSELSDLEDEPILDDSPPATVLCDLKQVGDVAKVAEVQVEDDVGEVLPDHWSGAVPIFRPTMHQFKDFQCFMKKVDGYGMRSGIIKIIPPPEWKDAQPPLDELVKYVKVREPIKQDIMGSNGTYRQVNILHGRSYNLPQWRQLCEQSEHQPPARRGERRANADKSKSQRVRPAAAPKPSKPSPAKKRTKGKAAKNRGKQAENADEDRPMTPESPKEEEFCDDNGEEETVDSVEQDANDSIDEKVSTAICTGSAPKRPKSKTQSVSARRKYSRREGSTMIDEAVFKKFDYRMDISDYTPERCEELERAYWKTLTYAPPLYGADLMGTLFDDRTDIWNLNKLPNLLDVLGTKVPGVNTAYLYLGMWKATFAWHLEDVDLYSINYLHFGAPKQWYSISQADARRFEAAMRSVWPADAKACNQFLRHKGFLISPHHLLQHYGIKVNKLVSYPGEFVVTYPYGYHSGYNLGYNCAEAVNFALDSWLEIGKIAKKCECAQAQDSVWVNVYEIERKLRGEETEYEETEVDEDEDGEGDNSALPTSPAGPTARFREANPKRKRHPRDKQDKANVKKIKLRLKAKIESPCCLCPHDVSGLEVLPTDDGRKAHRMCALYVPETYVDFVDDGEMICNVAGIHKDRLDLKCLFCRSRRGACFQCSKKKCARAYHATCAAAAGVFVEEQDVPAFGEDGTEFKEQAFEFSCRFHRTKRDKKSDGEGLESDPVIKRAAEALREGEICQFQFLKGEIFAGMVVENRAGEQMVLIQALPNGHRMEVEWKWLLLPDPSDFRLPKASAHAIPMPASRKVKDQLNAKRRHDEKPKKDDVFGESYIWAEFQLAQTISRDQAKVDLTKPDQLWYYLGKTSTCAQAQYTEDPTQKRHNPRATFLDTLPKPPKPAPASKCTAKTVSSQKRPVGSGPISYTQGGTLPDADGSRSENSYVYKPRKPMGTQMGRPIHALPKVTPTTAYPPFAPPPAIGPPHTGYQKSNLQPPTRMMELPKTHGTHVQSTSRCPAQQPRTTVQAQKASHAHNKSSGAPQSRPTWQIHSSVYHKYPFFQVNHNRDHSKYRTPYAQWGGFTNGYELSSRVQLLPRPSDMPRERVATSLPRPGYSIQDQVPRQAQGPGSVSRCGNPALVAAVSSSPTRALPMVNQSSSMLPSAAAEVADRTPQTAIKPQYTPAQKHGSASQIAVRPQAMVSSSKANSAHKEYKIGLPTAVNLALKSTKPAMHMAPKQSPVPLPANFLAAMASSPNGGQVPSSTSQQATAAWTTRQLTGTATLLSVDRQGSTDVSPRTNDVAQASPLKPTGIVTPTPMSMQTSTPVPIAAPTPVISPSILPPVQAAPQATVTPTTARAATGALHANADRLAFFDERKQAQGGVLEHLCGTDSPSEKIRQQEFPDVPGCESMKFVERMVENLKRASQRG